MPKFPIVGMQFRPAEGIPAPTIMSLLPPGSPLYLVREPSNPHDENAIQVWIKNVAEVIPDSLEDIREGCVTKDGVAYECPDLTQPLMLGFIKAASLNEEVLGSDVLAPRIDGMVGSGEISSAEEIPCELVYGESGRPALRIKAGEEGDDTADQGLTTEPDGINQDVAGEMNSFSEEFEQDRSFLNGEEMLEDDEDSGEDPGLDTDDLDLEEGDQVVGEDFTQKDEDD